MNKGIASVLGAVMWVAGIIMAKGFWLTVLAAVIPLYAYFVVVAKALSALGWV